MQIAFVYLFTVHKSTTLRTLHMKQGNDRAVSHNQYMQIAPAEPECKSLELEFIRQIAGLTPTTLSGGMVIVHYGRRTLKNKPL